MRLSIGIDMDGTLLAYIPAWREYMENQRLAGCHTTVFPREVQTWDALSNICATCYDHVVHSPSVLRQSKPWPGAALALDILYHKVGCKLHLISTRPPELREVAVEVLETYQLYHYFTTVNLHMGPKLPTLRELGCSAMVDDAPHNIAALENTDILPILFTQPYNRYMGAGGAGDFARADHWAAVVGLVMSLQHFLEVAA